MKRHSIALRCFSLATVLGIVVILSLSTGDEAYAVDTDGDGRDQCLALGNDPTLGLIVTYDAGSAAVGDAGLKVELSVKSAGTDGTWRLIFQDEMNGVATTHTGHSVNGAVVGDQFKLVATYLDNMGGVTDVETLVITVP